MLKNIKQINAFTAIRTNIHYMKMLYNGYAHRVIPVHYMIVLSELENYLLPTNDQLSLHECYRIDQYPWYDREKQPHYTFREDPAWFLNYE